MKTYNELEEELRLRNEVLNAIARTPEGRIAMAKVVLLELDKINGIMDDVLTKMEAKHGDSKA